MIREVPAHIWICPMRQDLQVERTQMNAYMSPEGCPESFRSECYSARAGECSGLVPFKANIDGECPCCERAIATEERVKELEAKLGAAVDGCKSSLQHLRNIPHDVIALTYERDAAEEAEATLKARVKELEAIIGRIQSNRGDETEVDALCDEALGKDGE